MSPAGQPDKPSRSDPIPGRSLGGRNSQLARRSAGQGDIHIPRRDFPSARSSGSDSQETRISIYSWLTSAASEMSDVSLRPTRSTVRQLAAFELETLNWFTEGPNLNYSSALSPLVAHSWLCTKTGASISRHAHTPSPPTESSVALHWSAVIAFIFAQTDTLLARTLIRPPLLAPANISPLGLISITHSACI